MGYNTYAAMIEGPKILRAIDEPSGLTPEPSGYQPLTDIAESRERLNTIAETQIEVPAQTLFECVLDVVASRRGKRSEPGFLLTTKAGMQLAIGLNVFQDSAETPPYEAAWMEITQKGNKTHKDYEVRKRKEGGTDSYELVEIDLDTEEGIPVSNWGNLAPARLLSILADAHTHTPIYPLGENKHNQVIQ